MKCVASELVLFLHYPFCLTVHKNCYGFDWSLHDWGAVMIIFFREGVAATQN